MTCIAAIRADTAIVFAADGVAYFDDGVVGMLATKLIIVPHMNMIITASGAGLFGRGFADQLQALACSFDDAKGSSVEAAMTAWREIEDNDEKRATIVFGGWSDANARYEAFKIHTHARETEAVDGTIRIADPWTLHELPPVWTSILPNDDAAEVFKLGALAGAWDACELAAYLICAARQLSVGRDDEGKAMGVGGFLQLAVLDRERTTTWIAHRWPDPIGEVVDPTRGEAEPEFLRRAIERVTASGNDNG